MAFDLRALSARRAARAAAGLVVLSGVAFAQYRLTNVPTAVDLEGTGKFTPASVRLGQELVIEGPVVGHEEGLLLSHDGKSNELVEAYFDRARLDEGVARDLRDLGLKPPDGAVPVDYLSQEQQPTPGAEACRTRVELRTGEGRAPSELRLFQTGTPGGERYRLVELTAAGAELSAHLLTSTPPESDDQNAPGCLKLLRAGDFEQKLTGVEIAAVVSDGEPFRFRFKALDPASAPWGGAEDFYEPFDLGVQKLKPTDPPPFQARAVSVRSFSAEGKPLPAALSARAEEGGPLLTVYGLKVGSDSLQVGVAGRGWLQVDGQSYTVNLLDRVQANPIPAALLAALNTALLAWFARFVFAKPRAAGGSS